MERYAGDVPLSEVASNNAGALAGLLKYVEKTFQISHVGGSDAEKKELIASIGIALGKVKVPEMKQTSIQDFELECLIGYGSYGRIWKADSEKYGPVALKQLKAEKSGLCSIWNERDLMVYLKNKRVCNMMAAFYDKDVYFVLELCHGSIANLSHRINRQNVVRFAIQLLQGLQWIHSQKVIHADIKPDNCLINTSNNLVISDFGSAFYLGKDKQVIQLDKVHGSPGYLDYRANKFLEFSTATDVFSAACVIFELNTKAGLLFYQGQAQDRNLYIDAFENGRVAQLDPHELPAAGMQRENLTERAMRSDFGFLLRKMISEDNRLSAADALEDPSLRLILVEAQVTMESLDVSTKPVTREFNEDHSLSFDNFDRLSPPEIELALLTFGYEEQGNQLEPDSDDDLPLVYTRLVKKMKVNRLLFEDGPRKSEDESYENSMSDDA